jgi:hypothetical protein
MQIEELTVAYFPDSRTSNSGQGCAKVMPLGLGHRAFNLLPDRLQTVEYQTDMHSPTVQRKSLRFTTFQSLLSHPIMRTLLPKTKNPLLHFTLSRVIRAAHLLQHLLVPLPLRLLLVKFIFLRFYPNMLHNLLQTNAKLRPNLDHSAYQRSKGRRDISNLLILTVLHHFIQFLGVTVLERQSPRQHRIKGHPQRPYFRLLRIVLLLVHHLWCRITGRPTAGMQPLPPSTVIAQSEVNEF